MSIRSACPHLTLCAPLCYRNNWIAQATGTKSIIEEFEAGEVTGKVHTDEDRTGTGA